MARKIIPLVTGEVYHIYNRGADKQCVFKDSEDFLRFYRSMLLFNSQKPIINFSSASTQREEIFNSVPLVEIHAYSLLPNHFHFLLKQLVDGGISEYMKRLSGGYTSYFNERYERSGVLFQGRYKKVHVSSQEQYQYLFAYVNENHYVHNLARPNEIMYSSSLHFERKAKSALISLSHVYNVQSNQKIARDIFERRNVAASHALE
jgi:putative transposase